MIVSKVVIDGLVTAAQAWATDARGLLPLEVRRELEPAALSADELGARLWQYNFDAFNYGGPPENAHPELIAEVEASGELEVRPDFTFESIPGAPTPEAVQRLIDFYLYQCQGDDWPGTDVERFVVALQSAVDAHAGGEDLRRKPGYERVPWDPDEDHRGIVFGDAGLP